jgi:hypothetical protein
MLSGPHGPEMAKLREGTTQSHLPHYAMAPVPNGQAKERD